MPKVVYVKKRFSPVKLDVIQKTNRIITEYNEAGYKLSLRQIYYRFVAGDLFPDDWVDPATGSKNSQKNYSKLGDILGDARMAGLVDWNAIEDRTRELSSVAHWTSPADIISACQRSFRLDKWGNQPYRLECWVEKDALEGIVTQAAHAQDVATFSCRGYGSLSSLWEASQRLYQYIEAGQRPVILHLGDHDPSGIDMTRDISERLNTFVEQDWLNKKLAPKLQQKLFFKSDMKVKRGDIWRDINDHFGAHPLAVDGEDSVPITIRRIALNMDQVEEYSPPPNPAKSTDSRYQSYYDLHGDESWELDALEPSVLDELITNTILEYRKEEQYEEKQEIEDRHRENLAKAAKHWNGKLAPIISDLPKS
jgi:hypothetical protein